MQEAGDNPLKNMAILYKLSTTSVQCTRLGGNMAILYKLSTTSVQCTRLGGNTATYTKTLNVNCFY